MKLIFCSTKKLVDKTKSAEKVANLEVVQVVLLQCNLVGNQYQQKSEVLYTFTPIYLVFLKNYNTDFDKIIITFMDQNVRPLEIKDKVNFLNRNVIIIYRTKNKKIY